MNSPRDYGAAPSAASLEQVLREQDGVVARPQLQELGLSDAFVRTRLRRGWRRVATAVYVQHSGPMTQMQRHWAAVLACWPAALSHASALPGLRLPGDPALIHVAVPSARAHRRPRGVVIHEMLAFGERVRWQGVPRVQPEHALLDVLRDRRLSEAGMVAQLCDAVRLGLVTPSSVLAAMEERLKVRERAWLQAVAYDLMSGSDSVLEQRFAALVERAHALPEPLRQRQTQDAATGKVIRRDAEWPDYDVVVELDGWQFHQQERRVADLQRDLAAAQQGTLTIRLSWRQVVEDPCRTAAALAAVLQRRGWRGSPSRCPQCP